MTNTFTPKSDNPTTADAVCRWLLKFCLEKSFEAFSKGDLARGQAFSTVAIATVELLEEDN